MSTPQNPNTAALAQAGVSIWLDDLSRTRLDEGTLEELIATRSVTGVTTNPSIFAVALADAGAYQGQLRELAAAGASVDEAVVALTTEDVRRAADVLAFFDRPGTSNGPTEAINGRLEHLRGSALGFRNLNHYILRSLIHSGGLAQHLDAL